MHVKFSTIVNNLVENYVNKYWIKLDNFVNNSPKSSFQHFVHLFSTTDFNIEYQLFPQPKFALLLDLFSPLLPLTNTPYYY